MYLTSQLDGFVRHGAEQQGQEAAKACETAKACGRVTKS